MNVRLLSGLSALNILSLTSLAIGANQIPSHLVANRLKVEINTISSFDSKLNRVSYKYEFISSTQSEQILGEVAIRTTTNTSMRQRPSGWSGNMLTYYPYWSWDINHDNYALRPGSRITGFIFDSVGLPGIVEAYYAASVPLADLETDLPPGMTEDDFSDQLDIFHNSNKTVAIGPTDVLVTDPPDIIAKHMAEQKHKLYNLKWIDNTGLLNSLDKKLDAFEKSLSKNNTQAASGQISAFRQEVISQKGKHINEGAASLLLSCADILLSKL